MDRYIDAYTIEFLVLFGIIGILCYHLRLVTKRMVRPHRLYLEAMLEARKRTTFIYSNHQAARRPLNADEVEVRLGYGSMEVKIVLPSIAMVFRPASAEGRDSVLILRPQGSLPWKVRFKKDQCASASVETWIMGSRQALTEDDRFGLESLHLSAKQQFEIALEHQRNKPTDPDEDRAIAEG